MSQVLVIGARGKTGRDVVATLQRRRGIKVRGASHGSPDSARNDLPMVHFDWANPATWPAALEGVTAVYVVKPKTPDPAATLGSFLKTAARLERCVLLSEIGCDHRDASTDERRAEQVVQESGISWTILRPNWFQQNFAAPGFFLEALRDDRILTVPSGNQPVSFVNTRDIAEVAVAALLDSGHAGRAYNLTGPEAVTFAAVAGAIGRAIGKSIRHTDPPLDEYLRKSAAAGTPQKSVDYYGRIYGFICGGEAAALNSDVRNVTGHAPRAMDAFIAENLNAWR
jgi:uncharacterized protein YbjT (DUF2867 family)